MKTLFITSGRLVVLAMFFLGGDTRVFCQTEQKIVKSFYTAHFNGEMALTKESLTKKKSWLCPSLYELLYKESAEPVDPSVVPRINGDPFTDSQEYPKKFRIIKSERVKSKSTVTVLFYDGIPDKRVDIELKSDGKMWKICDIRHEDGSTLVNDLKE